MKKTTNHISLLSKDYNVCYKYQGLLTFDTVSNVLEEIRVQIIGDELEKNKLYAIAVELLENSFKHQENIEDEVELVILKNDKTYRVVTLNTLKEEDKVKLLNKTDELNNSSLMEVKRKYKERMQENFVSAKGNAGLGIELIRMKSQNEIIIATDEVPNGNIVVVDVKIEF